MRPRIKEFWVTSWGIFDKVCGYKGYDVIQWWGEIAVLQISKVFCISRGG